MATEVTPVRGHSAVVDARTHPAGLRAIASLEALKGVLVLALGIFLVFFHTHAANAAESMLDHLHVDTGSRVGVAMMKAANRLSTAHFWTIAGITFTYSIVRFVEAWGLWNRRIWAEWFALLSGATYLPFELAKVLEKATSIHVAVFVINLIIVLYMLWIRIRERCWPEMEC